MNGRIRNGVRALLGASPLLLLAACQVAIGGRAGDCDDGVVVPAREPLLSRDPSMKAIAADLDSLEWHIDCFGSVVAKTPDVWGQARLTSYRQDTEKLLKNELNGFRPSRQGSLNRTDTATLTTILAFTGSGVTPPTTPVPAPEEVTKQVEAAAQKVSAAAADVAKVAAALEAASGNVAKAAAALEAKEAGRKVEDPPGVIADALGKSLAVEPVRLLDQKGRYLNYLAQARRTNEGDDTSDAPGYSLNLVRLPVSVLPGKKTDRGYGAEVTFTVTPVLSDDLLPSTFRELVVNDIIHEVGFPLAKVLEVVQREATGSGNLFDPENLSGQELRKFLHLERGATARLQDLKVQPPQSPFKQDAGTQLRKGAFAPPPAAAPPTDDQVIQQVANQIEAAKAVNGRKVAEILKKVPYPSASVSGDVKGDRPLPPLYLYDALGPGYCFEIAQLCYKGVKGHAAERLGYINLPDVQAILKEHLVAAHRFLADPRHCHLWTEFCTADLATAVRARNRSDLEDRRQRFRDRVRELTGSKRDSTEEQDLDRLVQFSATSALAWLVLIDSALLNDRLIEDVRRTAAERNAPHLCPAGCPQFFPPDPPTDARRLFAEYVKVRWPIHVFTLDPLTEEQNQDDALTQNRTTQFALTLAFARNQVNTRVYVNAMRKLDSEYRTIALNRTQVGSAHGDNTFGWRFYPRFQTPPVRGNLQTFVGGNILGLNNPNDGLRSRRLEPGPRECIALIVMPSFVPSATLDVTGNWFALANPKHKVFDHTQALHLSRTVQTILTDGCGVKDAHKYRFDDHRRLLARAEQLSARLPLQTHAFQVPVFNTLGGFELFGNSTTDLAPELYGWYGAPGLKGDGPTTLFLVGDHLSVNHTRILVGNVEVEADVELLSRQVMKVTVPAGVVSIPPVGPHPATPVPCPHVPHAHIHIATPYGVSRELEIPIVCGAIPCKVEAPVAVKPPADAPKPAGVKGTLNATLKVDGQIEPLTPEKK